MRKKLFISYASEDEDKAMAICDALEKRGLTCWISCRDISGGADFQDEIPEALGNAGAMLLVFSANANNSKEIKKELALAGQYDLIVVPVRAENVTPSKGFAYELATRQWLDLFADWDTVMEKLVQLVFRIIPDDSAEPSRPLAAAAPAPHVQHPAVPPPAVEAPAVPTASVRKGITKMDWWILAGLAVACVAMSLLVATIGGFLFFGTLGYGAYMWGKSRLRA